MCGPCCSSLFVEVDYFCLCLLFLCFVVTCLCFYVNFLLFYHDDEVSSDFHKATILMNGKLSIFSGEGYYRNTSCALILISMFLLYIYR